MSECLVKCQITSEDSWNKILSGGQSGRSGDGDSNRHTSCYCEEVMCDVIRERMAARETLRQYDACIRELKVGRAGREITIGPFVSDKI